MRHIYIVKSKVHLKYAFLCVVFRAVNVVVDYDFGLRKEHFAGGAYNTLYCFERHQVNLSFRREEIRIRKEEERILEEILQEIKSLQKNNIPFTWTRCILETCLLGG